MPIKLIRDKRTEELEEFGGILFSPPNNDSKVTKHHLCKKCFAESRNY